MKTLCAATAAIIACALAQQPPYIKTQAGNVHIVAAPDKDVLIDDNGETVSFSDVRGDIASNTAAIEVNTEAISSNTNNIVNLTTRSDRVDAMLGLGRRDTSGSDGPSLVELTQATLMVQQMATDSLEVIANSTVATVLVSSPARLRSDGGETLYIGGRNFFPGVPDLYTCEWEYTDSRGQVTVLTSEPATATTTTLIECVAPAWPHPPAQAQYITNLMVKESGELIRAETELTTAFTNVLPSMTDLTSTGVVVNIGHMGAMQHRYVFYIDINDADHPDEDIVVTTSFTNASLISSVSVAHISGMNRSVTINSRSSQCGTSNITLTARDLFGSYAMTFLFEVDCRDFIPVYRSRNTRSDNQATTPNPSNALEGLIFADSESAGNYGALPAMRTFQGARRIKITKISGANAGDFAIYQLVQPLEEPLLQTLIGCGIGGDASERTSSPSTTQYTTAYSGNKVAGTLQMVDTSGSVRQPMFLYLCGVGSYSTRGKTHLAFTSQRVNYDWRWYWQGLNQQDTMWSLFSYYYHYDALEGSRLRSYPGFKGVSDNVRQTGEYEISVSAL